MNRLLAVVALLFCSVASAGLSETIYTVYSTDTRLGDGPLHENILGTPIDIPNLFLYQTVAYCNSGDVVVSGGFVMYGAKVVASSRTVGSDGRQGWIVIASPDDKALNFNPPPLFLPNTGVLAFCSVPE